MAQDDYERGERDAITWAIAWLQERANQMNDPRAKAVLKSAAISMSNNAKRTGIGEPHG